MTNDSKQAVATIVDFLGARLDEDEERLKWTTARGRWEAHRNYTTQQRGLVRHQPTEDTLAEFVHPADAEHAVYWQPSRVLAEIQAKRAIVEVELDRVGARWEFITDEVGDAVRGRADSAVLRALALIYSDHADYRQEWTS